MIEDQDTRAAIRILICEDELLSAEDMAGLLRDFGYGIAGIVATGEEAVRMAQEIRPDLILMDIRLAGELDGIEAAERIRAELDLPVIYLTAYAEKDLLERGKLGQPYGYLGKPAGSLELRSAIETALYRHKADQKLRESEARRAKAEELAGLHSWDWDIATGRVIWSAHSYHAFGLDSEEAELSLDTFMNSVHPEDRELVRRALLDAVGGKRPYDIELRIVQPNGQERILHSRGEIQRDGTGQPISMQGMALDITEHQKAEQELRETADDLAEAQRVAKIGSWSFDLRANKVTWSDELYRIFGIEKPDFDGRYESFLSRVHPDDKSRVLQVNAQTRSEGTSFDLEYRIITPDSQVKTIREVGYADKDEQGRVVRCFGTAQDITQRKQAEEERDRILNMSYDLICVAGMDGYFKYLNPSWERVLGYPSEDLLSRPFLDFIHPEDRAKTDEEVRKLKSGGLTVDFENRYIHKDGSLRTMSWTAAPLPEKGLMYCVGRDITERLAYDQALRNSQFFLQHTLDALSAHIAILDEDGTILEVNEAWRRFANDNDASLPQHGTGLNYIEICDAAKGDWSEDAPEVARLIRSLMTGEHDEFQWEYPCHSPSEKRWFVLHGSRFLMENHVRVVLAHETITERKEAEEALRQSEERFRAIFEGASDSIWIKDRTLKFTHVNPAMCERKGVPASKIIGRRSKDIYGEEIGKQLEALDARILKGESIDLEQARKVLGTEMRFHDMLAPLRNQAGDIVGICGISRNITERTKAIAHSAHGDHDYQSPAMRIALEQALIAGGTDGIILLQGESGSGKDFLARWIHDHSKRSYGPYFSINCAAVSKELAESELFGHERGSFTGAVVKKKGLLELAEGGTILLNEIGELPLSLQSKLLTFLDTRSFMRVGGQRHITVNARLIAATHRDLASEVKEKRFLEPLFYRLNVFPIHIPPLRERIEDLPVLVEEIMSRLISELRLTEMPAIGPKVITDLRAYDWPGNVRELRNVLERALMLWEGGALKVHIPKGKKAKESPQAGSSDEDWSYVVHLSPDKSIEAVLREVEISLYEHALEITHGNKNQAAKLLGISRGALYRVIKRSEGKATD